MASADDLTQLFPAFAGVATESIEYWLDRAARIVGPAWTEADRDHAQLLLAAHHLTLAGLGTGAEAETAAAGASDFRRVKSGALEIERFAPDGSGGEYALTSYGRRFGALLKAERGGPRVTGTGAP